jgi:aminoglycoside phosphotransferase (APT) family kinase protein
MDLHSADEPDRQALVQQVRQAFPGLLFEGAVLDDSGGDYRVLVLDGAIAFRFPRRPHCVKLSREIAVLRALRPRTSTPVPDYQWVADDFSFAGYRYIPGRALEPAVFAGLAEHARVRLLDDLGLMLAALHRLDPAAILADADWPRAWSLAQFAERGMRQGLGLIADFDAGLAAQAQRLYATLSRSESAPVRVIHADLVAEHLLVHPPAEGLAGLIDFGDVSLGDPAQDFMGLWAYGRHAVEGALAAYGGDGAATIHRSRLHWARYRLDRVWQALSWGDSDEAAEHAAGLPALLDSL